MPVNIDREKTKKSIAIILEKIRTEADPLLLDEYHRFFKKEVSLFQRSKVAAYLLMLNAQGKNLRSVRADKMERKNSARTDAGSESKEAGDKRYTSAAEDTSPRYPLADDESKRLFFSVGRSRRVFPREILGLINTKTAIHRDDIGSIRILDNYSFVQVRDNVAEQIIESLNGINFRGRPLVVNYAKSRKDEESDENDMEHTSEQDQDHPEKEDI